MFGLNSADLMHKMHQQKATSVMREAERAQASLARRHETSNGNPAKAPTVLVRATVIIVLLLGLFVAAQQTFAEGPMHDPGGSDFFPEANLAYRMGHYYLISGEPDKALEWLTLAFEHMPDEVLQTVPMYQDWYWTLGEVQEAAGLYEEALVSYQQWLTLVGDDAAPWTVIYVQALEEQIPVLITEPYGAIR